MTESTRTAVLAAATEVLGAEPAAEPGRDLAELPGFNSFRAMEIVEQVEQRLDVELEAEDLVPANLFHLEALCAVFDRAASQTTGAP